MPGSFCDGLISHLALSSLENALNYEVNLSCLGVGLFGRDWGIISLLKNQTGRNTYGIYS